MIIPLLPHITITQGGKMAQQYGCRLHVLSSGRKFLSTGDGEAASRALVRSSRRGMLSYYPSRSSGSDDQPQPPSAA